ncbi:conserved hypothetical protein (DUF3667) [Formosa sp. Hel1_33_131]|jgi:hypothetical protein|uniref:DUF3667 domain-containing protein n=1 Tax=Formosa sp. Hel1_33_131 TaxID=1336794 RepID=UPI00084E1F24|nr:DUF3667 domain-containing protein [Formosa sp. Hel1_33_131]AOR27500.1 conserved hypothetical protein (DUF3667) [Formosa sp. Hel1_33_131]
MNKSPSKSKNLDLCQNCDTRFNGNYCPNCGQQLKEFQRPFKFLIVDLAGNIFSFDTRLWRSLKDLITLPGTYALEYINGHRMRYVPPLRLYVFISFLFFLLLSTFVSRMVVISEETKSSINSEIKEGMDKNDISADIGILNIEADSNLITGTELFKIIKTVINDPSRYMNSFLTFVSWTLFLLMPLYAFILWLFFRKSQPYFYCHLIFAINQHAFLFLLCGLVLGIKLLFPDQSSQPENYALLLIPIYMFIGKKQLYQKGWIGTFFRMFAAFFLYLMLFILVITLLFALWFDLNFL